MFHLGFGDCAQGPLCLAAHRHDRPVFLSQTMEHAIYQHAFFGRSPMLDAASLRRSSSVLGNVERLRRKLSKSEPVNIAAIGSSNVVRGGCEAWRKLKCSHPKYTDRAADGTSKGWLLQAFEAFNATWPHPEHRLTNRALHACA